MNRTLKLIAFLVCIFTLSVTALAQDVLPLPAAADEDAPRTTITLDKPVVFGAIQPGTQFSWTHIGGVGYKIKFYLRFTQQTIIWEPGTLCAAKCTTLGDPTELLAVAHDGDEVDWSVFVTMSGVKVKSEARRATVNEVNTAALLTPSPYQSVARNQVTFMKWAHLGLVTNYTLIIKNAETGVVVLKVKMNPATYCWDSSPYDLCQYTFGGANPTVQQVLKENKHYIWFVKSVGPTGERDVSNKFDLFTLSDV